MVSLTISRPGHCGDPYIWVLKLQEALYQQSSDEALIYSHLRMKFFGVGRNRDNPGNQLSLSYGWIISQCPMVGIILLLSNTQPIQVNRKKGISHLQEVAPYSCLCSTGKWHLCAAMGWADAETNTELPRRWN